MTFTDPPKRDKPRCCTQLKDTQDRELDEPSKETGEPSSLKENNIITEGKKGTNGKELHHVESH